MRIVFLLLFFSINFIDLCFSDYKGRREFYLQPFSAREAAMGRTGATNADNPNSIFSNPASASFLGKLEFSYNYDPYLSVLDTEDYRYRIHSYSFTAHIIKGLSLGINRRFFRKSKSFIRYTDDYSEYYEEFYYVKDYDTGITAAYKAGPVGLGINTRHVSTKRGVFKTKNPAYAFDFGILVKNDFKRFLKDYKVSYSIGISLLNMGKNIQYETLSEPEGLPTVLKIGYSVGFTPFADNKRYSSLRAEYSLEYSNVLNTADDFYWNYNSVGTGLEISASEKYFLRIGYYNQQGYKSSEGNYSPLTGISYGIGLKIPVYKYFKYTPFVITWDYGRVPWKSRNVNKTDYINMHCISIKYFINR